MNHGHAAQAAAQLGRQLLVPRKLLDFLLVRLGQVVGHALGQFGDGQPAPHDLFGRPALGHARHRAEYDVEVVTEFRAELDVDGEQAGQLFFAVDDPGPAMRVVLACHAVAAAEKGAPHTAVPAMKDSLTFRTQQFATCIGHHGGNPFLVLATRGLQLPACLAATKELIARVRVAFQRPT